MVFNIYVLIACGFAVYLRVGRAKVGNKSLVEWSYIAALVRPVLVVAMIRDRNSHTSRSPISGGSSGTGRQGSQRAVGSGEVDKERGEEETGPTLEMPQFGKIDDSA